MNILHRHSFASCLLVLISGALLCWTGCTRDFEEINTNPIEADNVSASLQFSYILNRGASERYDQWRGNLIYCSQWAQQLSGEWEVDRYITGNEDWLSAWWNDSYLRIGKDVGDILSKTEPGSNLYSMTTIFKVFFFQRLTDMYGDMPYSQAFQGATFPQPIFDTQEEIYRSFISELRQAVADLSEEKTGVGAADILYQGDIQKWKKFGNSVLLRVGMRLSEVDPALAEAAVLEAIAGGVMESNEDMAIVRFSGSNTDGPNASGIGEVFQDFGVTGHLFRYSDELVNFIIENNDPRETTLMETYRIDGSIDNTVGQGNHIGRPNGIDPGGDDYVFAQPRREIMVAYNSPTIYLSYAEVEFLKAEAFARTWASGDPETAYNNGIRAACQQLALYPNATPISDAEINDYLKVRNIAYRSSKAIEQINTQKWVALLFDGFEAYANYRRTGFPDITPGLSLGESDGNVPHRLRYPVNESVNNAEEYRKAVSRLEGGDVITAPLWWDVDE
ncbi:MAG: SusD/RagB family nutrient-binding outer membrane lipoprotein [Bacteroidota bacterium]